MGRYKELFVDWYEYIATDEEKKLPFDEQLIACQNWYEHSSRWEEIMEHFDKCDEFGNPPTVHTGTGTEVPPVKLLTPEEAQAMSSFVTDTSEAALTEPEQLEFDFEGAGDIE